MTSIASHCQRTVRRALLRSSSNRASVSVGTQLCAFEEPSIHSSSPSSLTQQQDGALQLNTNTHTSFVGTSSCRLYSSLTNGSEGTELSGPITYSTSILRTSSTTTTVASNTQPNHPNLVPHRHISKYTKPLNDEATNNTDTASPKPKLASPKVEEIFERILLLDTIEVGLLTHLVNEKLGFPPVTKEAIAAMSSGGGGGGGGGGAAAAEEAAPVEEKTSFELKLVSFDAKAKIKVIKEVRAMTGLGLKEAKEMVEGASEGGGKVVKKDIKKEEAEELKEKLEGLGAQVEIV